MKIRTKFNKICAMSLSFLSLICICFLITACKKETVEPTVLTPISINIESNSSDTYYLRYLAVYYAADSSDFVYNDNYHLLFRIENKSSASLKVSPDCSVGFLSSIGESDIFSFESYSFNDLNNEIYFKMYAMIERSDGISYNHWGKTIFEFKISNESNKIVNCLNSTGLFILKTKIYGDDFIVTFNIENLKNYKLF